MEEIRRSSGKTAERTRRHSFQSGNYVEVDTRAKTSELKKFYESLNDSSVVKKGHQMQGLANQRKPVNGRAIKHLQDLASQVLNYIPEDKYSQTSQLVKQLVFSAPTTLEQLEAYAKKANKLYEFIDFKLIDKSKFGINYRDKMSHWRSDFQTELYNVRDELIQATEGGLMHFGIEKQFHRLNPNVQTPSCLTVGQQQVGVILFDTSNVENDCLRFASRLLNELVAASMGDLWKKIESGELEDQHIKDAFRDVLKKAPRRDILNYKHSGVFPCGYHAKTSLGSHDGKVYSLEAHKGKPFMLAPELCEFNSLDDYLEMQDQYVETRSMSGIAKDLKDIDLDKTDIPKLKGWIKNYANAKPNKYLGQK